MRGRRKTVDCGRPQDTVYATMCRPQATVVLQAGIIA